MTGLSRLASGRGRRILIIDDDEAVLKGLGDYFSRLDYDVIRATSGKQGVLAWEAQEPEVTILDLRLPDMDGMQVLEVLRRMKALVILLTGYGDIPTAVQAMQLGAENFLTKPVDLPHLVATVERALEKVDLRRENVRLRGLIPTTKKRLMQALVVLVLVTGSWLLGRLLGGLGAEQPTLPVIAPTRGNLNAVPAPRDTLNYPGQPPGGATAAPSSGTPGSAGRAPAVRAAPPRR